MFFAAAVLLFVQCGIRPTGQQVTFQLIEMGGRAGLERGLDGGGDELRGLRIDGDVPAEQHPADDLPGVPGRILRVGSHVSPPC